MGSICFDLRREKKKKPKTKQNKQIKKKKQRHALCRACLARKRCLRKLIIAPSVSYFITYSLVMRDLQHRGGLGEVECVFLWGAVGVGGVRVCVEGSHLSFF